MVKKSSLYSAFLILVFAIAVKWFYDSQNSTSYKVVVCIISAQENFDQRKALRETWLSSNDELGITHYFIIGELFCPIPPEYRSSYLSCERWDPYIEDVSGETILSPTRVKTADRVLKPFEGFSFILSHEIIITRIGVDSSFLEKCKQPVRVTIEDAISNQKVVTSSFIHDDKDNNDQGIVWKNIKPTYLYLGFEGTVYASSDCLLTLGDIDLKTELHDETNIVRFLQNIDNNTFHAYRKGSTSMVTFSYSIANFPNLKRKIADKEEEFNSWFAYTKKIKLKILEEKERFNDIVLVNVVDVYRSLPKKMIEFYKWLNKNVKFEYVLKTDDDVFIDLSSVMEEVRKGGEWRWWSCFREGWPVQRAGKWRETALQQTEYPPFPSGAGYIVHSTVVDYLVANSPELFMNAQGEDVSMGIWLEDLKLLRKPHNSGCSWACNNTCKQENCNVMELGYSQIESIWLNYKSCGNKICWCP